MPPAEPDDRLIAPLACAAGLTADSALQLGQEVSGQRDPLLGSGTVYPDLEVLVRRKAKRPVGQRLVGVRMER